MSGAADDVDGLATEASAHPGIALDALPTAEFVAVMNDRDARLAGAVRAQATRIARVIDEASERMRRGGRLIYVGAGTSGRLGVLDASEVPPTFGVEPGIVVGIIAGGPDALVTSAEGVEDDPTAGAADVDAAGVGAADTAVGIAASGRTPYVIGALERARERGALTVGLSCNTGTPVSAAAELAIEVAVGPEVLAGSTRLGAGTATKLVLNTISTGVMVRLGKTYRSLMVDVKASNAKLRRRATRIVCEATGADETQAVRALEQADWGAKLAIAMLATGLSAPDARAALDAAGGVLGRLIGD
ncbi:N-acetylmuramic acid 6-phosphate etherase [Gryllotalpicola ginsengisoli]|uniref:N-acetylmuramic acid 6-phosphate etherase n=1 Tax=Gryllotalpicola ginsengisoli TaxID=444608 RepID=UPI0003B2FA69|nr:N-acetylmuramic acid 6-phosphate etherase [Gryllotalpicola ginsengisoli]